MRAPLFIKRLPVIGRYFWNTKWRPIGVLGIYAGGTSRRDWFNIDGTSGGDETDMDGDVVREWGDQESRPFKTKWSNDESGVFFVGISPRESDSSSNTDAASGGRDG